MDDVDDDFDWDLMTGGVFVLSFYFYFFGFFFLFVFVCFFCFFVFFCFVFLPVFG